MRTDEIDWSTGVHAAALRVANEVGLKVDKKSSWSNLHGGVDSRYLQGRVYLHAPDPPMPRPRRRKYMVVPRYVVSLGVPREGYVFRAYEKATTFATIARDDLSGTVHVHRATLIQYALDYTPDGGFGPPDVVAVHEPMERCDPEAIRRFADGVRANTASWMGTPVHPPRDTSQG